MEIEDDDQVTAEQNNRGSLSFFDEDEGEQNDTSESSAAKLMDDIRVSVVKCDKEGNDFCYAIKVMVNGEEREIKRMFKDLQWLHRFLNRNMDLGGYILPPFPDSPSTMPDLPAALLIGTGEAMFGSVNRRHCLRMERFLAELACHRYFSEHHIVKSYLISEDLNTVMKERERLGAGTMWSQVTKVYSDYQLGKIQDPDEGIDSFFKYVCTAIPNAKGGYETFSTYVFKWQKLAVQIAEMRNQFQEVSQVDRNKTTSLFESQYSEIMLDLSATEALASLDGALTLAATLSHQFLYLTECKEMLLRRLSAHQSLVAATQQLGKATKPEKKEIAQKNKEKWEEKFNTISEIAKTEVELFQHQYRQELRQTLLSYTESQVAHGRRTLESLAILKARLVNDSSDKL